LLMAAILATFILATFHPNLTVNYEFKQID